MSEITRKGFLGAVAGAVVVPAGPAAPKVESREDLLVRMGRLLAAVTPAPPAVSRKVSEWVLVAQLHTQYQNKAFPVPDWLAAHHTWQGLEEIDRERADGTYCSEHEDHNPFGYWNCGVCGVRRSPSDPVHYSGDGDDTKACCPDCCPACRKRAGLPPKEVPPPEPEPTEQELIDRSVRYGVREGRAAFAVHLKTARAMWRKYPELVTAQELPEVYAAAYRDVYEDDWEDSDLGADEDAHDPGFMAHVLEEAKEYAQSRLAKIAEVRS